MVVTLDDHRRFGTAISNMQECCGKFVTELCTSWIIAGTDIRSRFSEFVTPLQDQREVSRT